MKNTWHVGTVLKGEKLGRTIGFPTINLSPTIIPHHTIKGVYAASVVINSQQIMGALYLGPRLVKEETHTVLEIYLLDFDKDVYDEEVQFQLHRFVRKPEYFSTVSEMKLALEQDVEKVRKLLSK